NVNETGVRVVGAGLGGLAATLALQQAGIPVIAFEQAPDLSEFGAGIMLTPNASRVLRHLGVFDDVAAEALRPGSRRVRHWQGGAVPSGLPFARAFRDRYGAPFLTIHRADLQRALADGVRRNDPAAIRLDHRLVDVEQRDGKAVATFANGNQIAGDSLVGCDG